MSEAQTYHRRFSPDDATWAERIDELRSFRSLGDDWDGEGSPAPAAELVDAGVALAESLHRQGREPPTRVLAGVNGTIFLEWQTLADYRVIEVESPVAAEERHVQAGSDTVSVTPLRLHA